MKIAYFVHNIDDAAVRKRVTMLSLGGAQARLIGFSRFTHSGGSENASDSKAVVIGRSSDGKFFQRILVVLRCILWPFDLIGIVKASDAILCRNLEMLALGYAIKVLARSRAPLTYECLDIHGKLLGDGLSARVLRRIELFLMNRCQTVITSSPGFIRNYFHAIQNFQGAICLVENKVIGGDREIQAARPAGTDGWTIGWFGIIRCRKSLDMLDRLSRALPAVEVVISGRVAHQEFDDFDATVAANPRLSYTGPFQPDDLPDVYGRAHFVWAIDYYEEGENSTWLLPNRLYDSLAFGAVPIALEQVETGQWLTSRDAGVVINAPLADLPPLLETLTQDAYLGLKGKTKRIPPTDIFHDQGSVADLLKAIAPPAPVT
jgi:succinoglycan biosynthesis protein ExoL